MEKVVGAFEACRQLGRILKDVSGRGDRYVVEYHGEPVAAVVPIELYEQWKRQRESFFGKLEELATTSDLSAEEADALAEQAVRAVRQARN
ncbi:MAG: type II toxin-antitoxin system Phd/YefM family antitoxin [Chloroflexota bacterium]|nr:type II toxin-antitoxin system Phd/YefM family antitoxin [Chloroflexota bacterium]